MKKKICLLFGFFVVLIIISNALIRLSDQSTGEVENKINIVTSFYPTNILVENACKNMEGVTVSCLTEYTTGCLHDYQLTTQDMRKIADADIFVMNGGGMESYVETILKEYPDLYIIDLSENIELVSNNIYNHDTEIYKGKAEELQDHDHADEIEDEHDHNHAEETEKEYEHNHVEETETEHDHEHAEETEGEYEHNHDDEIEDEHGHDHGEYNAHVFTDPTLYQIQLDTFEKSLKEYLEGGQTDEALEMTLEDNVREYRDKLDDLSAEFDVLANSLQGKKTILFHDAFVYTARRVGMEVSYIVDMETDAGLSAGDIAKVIDKIKEEHVSILMIEKQFDNAIAEQMKREADVEVVVIDSCVTGDGSLDSYLDAMEYNIEVLQKFISE